MAAENDASRMTEWRISQVQDPALKEKLRKGVISAREAHRTTGCGCTPYCYR
ncbi:MAG: hypothetical protein R6U51_04945 [Anaerolineales bacterium]